MDNMEIGTQEVSGTNATPAPIQDSAPAQTEKAERTFNQREVNDLVGRTRQEAVERYKRAQERESQPSQSPQTPSYNEQEVRRLAAEEAQRLRDDWIKESQKKHQETEAQRIASEFFTKLQTGKEKYQDFEKTVNDIDFRPYANVVQIANNFVDNTADVIYELSKDRTKLASLEVLSNLSPKDAIYQLQRLAQSIKDNEAAGKAKVPNEPLSQLRPTNSGTDNGTLTVRDYRRKYKV